ncbi:hypothetical protein [Bacillus thuringiensis]|uniref:Uncharacterized protein n=1 Tax=Bacillus thuringiensis TaxID=1428 RepID=A0AAW4HZ53_BACTU|nr:hypothetical protein [Bacillus thuringiensis]MCU4813903.1 hypothetical protein [Bacillus cereus]MBN9901518.1 hypothetical protein [Bacillus thuringiensis]MCU5758005.1 hypothetical protein [Bacillus cereus]MDY7521754.1 hypothetical protein [Bacillus thuringiensis]HDX9528444.1 hypothetical protein [Bacillus thuringiensis]
MKVLMGLSFMFGCIFITSGNAEAASGGWYKVTAAGNNCKARVNTDQTEYKPNNKTVGMQLEAEGNCSNMYYDTALSDRDLESVAHDTTVGSFSSKIPIKQIKIGNVREKETTDIIVQLYKDAAHTQPIGKLISNNIIIYPR